VQLCSAAGSDLAQLIQPSGIEADEHGRVDRAGFEAAQQRDCLGVHLGDLPAQGERLLDSKDTFALLYRPMASAGFCC